MPDLKCKKWNRLGIFDSYETAEDKKNDLLKSLLEDSLKKSSTKKDSDDKESEFLVKIKRCGPKGSKFQVKYWVDNPQDLKKNKGKKRSKRR
jgi:hypothetical protein